MCISVPVRGYKNINKLFPSLQKNELTKKGMFQFIILKHLADQCHPEYLTHV